MNGNQNLIGYRLNSYIGYYFILSNYGGCSHKNLSGWDAKHKTNQRVVWRETFKVKEGQTYDNITLLLLTFNTSVIIEAYCRFWLYKEALFSYDSQIVLCIIIRDYFSLCMDIIRSVLAISQERDTFGMKFSHGLVLFHTIVYIFKTQSLVTKTKGILIWIINYAQYKSKSCFERNTEVFFKQNHECTDPRFLVISALRDSG